METKKTYFMFVHKDIDGLWCTFPDLPECMTDGDDLENLIKNATECLESYMIGVSEVGKTMPQPSGTEELKKKADQAKNEVLFIVPVTGYLPSTPARINVTSTEAKIAEITAFAKRVKRTRSELMVEATLQYIRSNA